MGVTYTAAPQWLLSSWVRSCVEAGATAPELDLRVVGEMLIERWAEPGRHFHDLRHLADVLNRVDELAEEAHEPDLVRLAAWYHGAVFDAATKAAYATLAGENEAEGALLAHRELTDLGLPPKSVDRVAFLVNALLRHDPAPGDFDCAVLCDADLGGLAVEPQRYKAYREEIRREYAHVPLADFLRVRIAIVTKLLSRTALFSSPLGAVWEVPARQNLAAELQRLIKEQARLTDQDTTRS